MQIAKMFASLGFNVDTSGLDKFRQNLKQVRAEINNLGRDSKTASKKIRSLSSALDGLSSKLDRVSIKRANDNISKSYQGVARSLGLVERALNSIQTNQKKITNALGKIHSSVKAGEPLWNRYSAAVRAARHELDLANIRLREIRANSDIRIRINEGRGFRDRDRSSGGGNGGSGFGGGGNAGGFAGGFFRSMLPAVAMAGILPAAGFGVKEIVQRGRDQQRMENILMFATKDAKEFADALQYVRKESLRLGLDTAELGRAFAQVQMSAGDKLSMSDKKAMFKDMSEYIMTTGAGQEDQKLIFKAVNQMFSLGKMQAEEMNQLTERGIPREMIYRIAKETLGLKTNEQVQKAQKEGKLDPSVILPKLFKAFADKAHESGAFQKAMESSQTKQNIATQEFNALAKQIMDGGLDKTLANLFVAITDLTKVLSDIVEGFKAAKAAIDEMTNGNSALSIILTIVLALLFKKRTAVVGLVKNFKSFSGIMRVITGFLNGGFGQAILKTIGRFGLWGLAITAVITGFQKIGNAMKRRASGEWTWIDDLMLKYDTFALKLKVIGLKYDIFMHNLMNGRNRGQWEVHSSYYPSRTLEATDFPNRNVAANKQKVADSTVKTMRKISESATGNIPLASAGNPLSNFGQQIPDIVDKSTKNFTVIVDGVTQKTVNVTEYTTP